jgi:hypothetical protein
MVNFDKAAADLDRAAGIAERGKQEARGKEARQRAASMRNQARNACRLAALACERASEDLGEDGAGLEARAAVASQSAAVWWEKLAARK